MKKLLVLFFVLISFSGFAQHWNKVYSYNEYLGLQADSVLLPPGDTLASTPIKSLAIKNNHVYQKLSTGVWSQVDGGGNAVQSLTGSQSIQYGTFLAMPSPGTIGRFYAATDSARWYFDNGVAWINLSGSGGGGGGGATLTFGYGIVTGSYNGSTPVTIVLDTTLISTRAWRQKGIDSLNAVKKNLNDSSANNPAAFTTQASRQKLADSIINLLAGYMVNYGGAPGWLVGTNAGIPAATSYNPGVHYTAKDSGFIYIDTGSGGTRGWKKISGGGSGSAVNAVVNFLNSQQLGYGVYASKPTTGTAFYYASDSAAWFYVNAGTATNLTPAYNVYFRGKGQPGDTSYVYGQGNNIWVRAKRDSLDYHHTVLPDSSEVDFVQAHDTTSGNALQPKYRSDTARANIYSGISSKLSAVSTTNSITGNGTPGTPVQLVNDASAPGANKVYGTDGSGTKGWQAAASGGGTPSAGLNTQVQTDGGTTYVHASNILPINDTFYILASGQSNMGFPSNTGPIGDTATDSRVQIWNWFTGAWVTAQSGVSPFTADGFTHSGNIAWYFAKKLAAATNKHVRIVLHYKPSTSITQWFNGASKGPQMDSLTGKAVASGVTRFDVFMWDQGEQDNALQMNTYLANWDSIKAYLRRQPYFPPTTPIIVCGMPKVSEGSASDLSYSDRTLRTVDGNLDQWDGYANADSATVQSAQIHYDNPGQKVIGLNAFAVYQRLPIILPTSRVHANYLKMYNTDSSGTASEPQQIVMQNQNAFGWSGLLVNDPTGTSIARLMINNPSSPANSGVFGTNEFSISGEHSVSKITMYTAFTKRGTFSSTGFDLFGGLTQTQTGTALYNSHEFIGEDNLHTWFIGGVASAYNNAPTNQGSFTLYNLTNGPQWNVSPVGLMRVGKNVQSGQARVSLDGTVTANNGGTNGMVFNSVLGVISDNSTTGSGLTTPWLIAHSFAADTGYFAASSGLDTAANAVNIYVGGGLKPQTAHTFFKKSWALYVNDVLANSVFRGHLFLGDTTDKGGYTFQLNGAEWQNKDSLPISSAGSVMALGIDTTTGKHVRFSVSSGGSSPPFADNTAIIKNNSDNTKTFKFDASALPTATLSTGTLPGFSSFAFATLDHAQTFSGLQQFGNLQVNGFNWTFNLGTSSTLSPGSPYDLGINTGIDYVQVAFTSSFTMNMLSSNYSARFIKLGNTSSAQTVTLDNSGSTGRTWSICNMNTSTGSWSFAGTTLTDGLGNTVTTIPSGYTYEIFFNGSTYEIKNITSAKGIPIAGSYSNTGTATTTFTVTIGTTEPTTSYKVNVTPTDALGAALFYVTNKTTTTFDVVYLSGLTGTVSFDWNVIP